ncbi:MAG: transporter substrate-binding protein [Rubritepida sp.]|nr:transporter substrate-binding protein [Rubritepida sp.]
MNITRRILGAGAAATLALPALAQSTPVLRIGNQKGGLRSLIEVSGQARDLPYRIEWSEFPFAAPLLEALNAAAIDLGTQGDLAFFNSYANGAPIKAIGVTRDSQASQGILVRGDSAIRTVADLRGKKVVGNRGGWGQFLVRAALKREGISPSEVDIVHLAPGDASLAFRTGAVDAWAAWEPYNSIEILGFGARTLVDATGLSPTAYFISVHENALREKRPLLQDFLQRVARGWSWTQDNIPAFARNTSELTRIQERFLQRAYETTRTRVVPIDAPLLAELQRASDEAVEFGVLSRPIRVSEAFDTTFAVTGS